MLIGLFILTNFAILYKLYTYLKNHGDCVNILFLDCDGVINTIDSGLVGKKQNNELVIDGVRQPFVWYKRDLIPNINALCDRYSLKVVVSSTWRKDHPINYFKTLCHYMGLTIQVIDYTTSHTVEYDREVNDLRSNQISLWLNENKDIVDDYLVIDDMVGAGHSHKDRFIQTDSIVGFDKKCYMDTIKRFDSIFGVSQ